mmetsp:Transcript_21795/g.63398  ORF Transcript_21795/g.63398 Transcript_21795/m.63398 type:complete len:205 (-) Transcript_21795:1273-1887(-)
MRLLLTRPPCPTSSGSPSLRMGVAQSFRRAWKHLTRPVFYLSFYISTTSGIPRRRAHDDGRGHFQPSTKIARARTLAPPGPACLLGRVLAGLLLLEPRLGRRRTCLGSPFPAGSVLARRRRPCLHPQPPGRSHHESLATWIPHCASSQDGLPSPWEGTPMAARSQPLWFPKLQVQWGLLVSCSLGTLGPSAECSCLSCLPWRWI